jgi:hypothetical protein
VALFADHHVCCVPPAQAAEVIVGEKGRVTGMVAGQNVVVRGKVSGVVCGKTVALQASSHVDGDIHHMSFAITSQGPILPGTISTARAKCGKPTCRCRQDPKFLHGPYYRWTGWINDKPTTKTVSQEIARECHQAPWTQDQKK